MRHDADLVFETERTFVRINAAIRQAVRELIGGNHAMPQRGAQQIVGKVADAEPADFSLLSQFPDGFHGFLDGSQGIGPVGKIQVNALGAQSLEAQFATFCDMRSGEVACSAIGLLVAKEGSDLGDDDRLLATTEFLQRPPQDLFGQSQAIAFSRVEQVDPGINAAWTIPRAAAKSSGVGV